VSTNKNKVHQHNQGKGGAHQYQHEFVVIRLVFGG
jgi:hypothetical protein